ncbi:MAG TPA: hypothetical protein VFY14_17075, partial [Streptomyces sp.]|nr:hypothetical protein [Streptomyces sp.]
MPLSDERTTLQLPDATPVLHSTRTTPRRVTAMLAAEALGEDVHALWPALRQPRSARAVSPELMALYDQ